MVYPSTTIIAGQSCSGVAVLGPSGQGYFCPGNLLVVKQGFKNRKA
jgi:hypothetical protein